MFSRGRSTLGLAVLAALFTAPAPAMACSCMPSGPPCEAFYNLAAVFVGRVESIAKENPDSPFGNRRVRFDVSEAFRGVSSSQVDVTTGSGGGDCGYAFEVGETYMVYAYQPKDSTVLSTGICSRTRVLRDATEDLAFARAQASAPALGGVVTGVVRNRDRRVSSSAGGQNLSAPVANIGVRLDCGGVLYDTVTDSGGRFTVNGLAAGSCAARFALPANMYLSASSPLTLNIRDVRACATVDVAVAYDGHIRGRIVDAAGHPVAGVTLDLIALGKPYTPGNRSAVSAADGAYELDKVAPGSYQVGVNTRTDFDNRRAFGQPAYFPGVTSPDQATTISVKAGEHREVGDLVLPSEIRFVQVSGLVLAVDGRPAAGAKIFVRGADEHSRVFSGPLVTTGDGRFIVAIPAGERASLVVEWPRPLPEKPYNFERGDVPTFVADRDRADLWIVVRPIKQ